MPGGFRDKSYAPRENEQRNISERQQEQPVQKKGATMDPSLLTFIVLMAVLAGVGWFIYKKGQ